MFIMLFFFSYLLVSMHLVTYLFLFQMISCDMIYYVYVLFETCSDD
jgi:hypothetical protein